MVDWELTTLGDPMVDLGWLLSAWPEDGADTGPVNPWLGFPSRSEIVSRYAEVASTWITGRSRLIIPNPLTAARADQPDRDSPTIRVRQCR